MSVEEKELKKEEEIEGELEAEKFEGSESVSEEAIGQEVTEKSISDLQKEIEDYKNKWITTYSDFENYKKRVKRDIEDAIENTKISTMLDFIEIIDSLEYALTYVKDDDTKTGLELVLRNAKGVLEKYNISEIDVKVGDDFDWRRCEAVSTLETDDFNDGKIIQIVKKGYEIKTRDKNIRPAYVIVSKKKGNGKNSETDKEEENHSYN